MRLADFWRANGAPAQTTSSIGFIHRLALLVMLLPSLAWADYRVIQYDPVGDVDENAGLAASEVAPGFVVSSLRAVGVSNGNLGAFQTNGWNSGGTSPTLTQYIEFSVTGIWTPSTVRFPWFCSSFGPGLVAIRSNQNNYLTNIATASRNCQTISLDISSLGAQVGTRIFRLYFYGGTNGGGALNTVVIDGTRGRPQIGPGFQGVEIFSSTGPARTDLGVSIQSLPGTSPVAGADFVHLVEVTNNGPASTDGVAVNLGIVLKPGILPRTPTTRGGSYDLGTGIWTIDELNRGQTFQLELRFGVDADLVPTPDLIRTTATITSQRTAEPPNTTANNTATLGSASVAEVCLTSTLTPVNLTAGIAPTTNSATSWVGENGGPSTAFALPMEYSYTAPAGVTLTQAAPSPGSTTTALGPTAARIQWANVARGNQRTVDFQFGVPASATDGSQITLSTRFGTSNPVSTCPEALRTVQISIQRRADIGVSSTRSQASIALGEGQVVHTIRATNNGPSDASNILIDLTRSQPTGVTTSATAPGGTSVIGGNQWSIPALAAGASVSLDLSYNTTGGLTPGAINTSALLNGYTEQGNIGTNDSTSQSTSVTNSVDIGVSASENPASVVAGSGANNLSQVVTVQNNGPSPASNISVNVARTLPAGVNLAGVVPATGAWNDANPGTWTIPALASGASTTLTVNYTVFANAQAGTDAVSLSASLTSVSDPDSQANNDSASVSSDITREVDLTVTAVANPQPVIAGLELEGFSQRITVLNQGPSDAQAIVVNRILTLPAGVTVEDTAADAGAVVDDNWTLDLAAGDSAELTLVSTVGPETVPGVEVISLDAAVTGVAAGTTLLVPEDDASSVSTDVEPTRATIGLAGAFGDGFNGDLSAAIDCSSGEAIGSPFTLTPGVPLDVEIEGFLVAPFGTTECRISLVDLPPGFEGSDNPSCLIGTVDNGERYSGCELLASPLAAPAPPPSAAVPIPVMDRYGLLLMALLLGWLGIITMRRQHH